MLSSQGVQFLLMWVAQDKCFPANVIQHILWLCMCMELNGPGFMPTGEMGSSSSTSDMALSLEISGSIDCCCKISWHTFEFEVQLWKDLLWQEKETNKYFSLDPFCTGFHLSQVHVDIVYCFDQELESHIMVSEMALIYCFPLRECPCRQM